MAKIRFLNDVAVYNRETATWECPDEDVAALLQTVLENQARSVNGCMRVCERRYHAIVLEWDEETPIDEQAPLAS